MKENNYTELMAFAEKSIEALSTNEDAYAKYTQLKAGVEKAIKYLEDDKEDKYDLKADEKVFVCALARDLVDNAMSDLFRLNMLADKEELVKEYYALPSREQISDAARHVQELHMAEEKKMDEEIAERRERNRQFTLFQQFALGKIADIEATKAEMVKKEAESNAKQSL